MSQQAEKQEPTDLVVPDDIKLPVVAQQRGIAPHQWNALKKTVWPGASDDMILTAIDYCKARGLNPIKKPIHIVKAWNSETKRMEEAIWEGIASHRIEATRTGEYAGQDLAEFGPDKDLKFDDRTYSYPEWCRVTIYKMVQRQRVPFVGPTLHYLEIYARKRNDHPNKKWSRSPRYMLEKCAEAAALRRAFPEELGGIVTAEEMEDQEMGPDGARDITPAKARPTKSDYKGEAPKQGDDFDRQFKDTMGDSAAAEREPGDETEDDHVDEPVGEEKDTVMRERLDWLKATAATASNHEQLDKWMAKADTKKALVSLPDDLHKEWVSHYESLRSALNAIEY